MAKRDEKPAVALGFLTVIEHEQHGLFGGYLVLNLAGRPLEFHCTAPVKPNRAQQILYGPTLEPYLYGEQIGQALCAKCAHDVLLICTDSPHVLALRSHTETPVTLVLGDNSRAAMAAGRPSGPLVFAFGKNQLALPENRQADREVVLKRLQQIGEVFDLEEPFGRIRAAIEEAQRGSRAAA